MSRQEISNVVTKDVDTTTPQAMLDVRLHETASNELTVQLVGELDLASAELLTAVVRCRTCPSVVHLDLAGLTFVDCAGLRAIEAVQDRMLADSAGFELVHVSAPVRRLLRMAGLDGAFAIGLDASRS